MSDAPITDPGRDVGNPASIASGPPRLLDRVRQTLRTRHYSPRTEKAYVSWIRRFVLFHEKRHPLEMGRVEVERFLTHLAVQQNVSASTQNQAFSAGLIAGDSLPTIATAAEGPLDKPRTSSIRDSWPARHSTETRSSRQRARICIGSQTQRQQRAEKTPGH